ncbi:tribbles homolog 2-like [Toxorhynchites rutilus septentrionalis]|uniref:tribbles homolog 2-like n=1 Tax=Toxorhynchites rutilus septentrionalis TaxID=329112 RepID=UPI002478ED45|nr:tribbles homolog 2-like [Toxorhynchites rutilus septentrionalis]XP_055637771.1 tribbles homolog 2-like [Toxorhynchites rutilus septentrionalis]XP_055637772.1 tribbles homolog 2-like [Toxorhynchites rutilus septentrionalis]XP_055637773.1 tribbles homolog 2-like [Toxorhynchites rutilus septentrionalis]
MDTINTVATVPTGVDFARFLLSKPDEPSTSSSARLIPVTVSASGNAVFPATITFVNSPSTVALANAAAAAAAAAASSSAVSSVAVAGAASAANNGPTNKKCPYHRQCYRNHHHHQQQSSSSRRMINTTASGAGSTALYPQRDAISTNATPPLNAAVLAERYLLLDIVEGSSLYRCVDIKTQEELVCKIANNPCSNLLTAHFRLDGHPHVNYLHKVIQGSNQTYLFFAPSQGDLHSHVRIRKRLREPEARRLFRQMCEVVKTCHEQGIVLRDLKLRKFVFADSERIHLKLESLEDAVVLDDPAEDLLQDKRGCPAYVSPEILKANTTYSGKAADMWSLGVILYTMLVGRYPFNDSEHASLFAKISRGHFTVPDCLSSKARCIIRALLRREPDERIASEDVLYHPWLLHDDSRDQLTYVSRSNPSANADDQCVPEWLEPTENDGDGLSSGHHGNAEMV